MTSVERIQEYAELEPEPPLESDAKNAPPAGWPSAGKLVFNNLNLRYAENSSRVLRNLTFDVTARVCDIGIRVELL